jgi:DNA-binding NtrC family response regulator
MKEFAEENGKAIEHIDDKSRAALYAYNWPGNVRELRNCMESAVVMCKGNVITLEDLPPTLRNNSDEGWIKINVGTSLAEAEKIIIMDTLSAQKGNKSKTAEVLDIGRKTLHRKLAEYSLAEYNVTDDEEATEVIE